MATIPTVFDATAAQKLTATQWNAQVRDPLNFLMDPPHCDLTMTATTALASGTATLVVWDNELTDTDAMHSTVTNQSRIIVQTAGRFIFVVSTNLTTGSASATTQYNVNLRINAAGSSAGGTSVRTWPWGVSSGSAGKQTVATGSRYMATPGDYFELFVTTTPATTLDGGNGVFATGIQFLYKSLT